MKNHPAAVLLLLCLALPAPAQTALTEAMPYAQGTRKMVIEQLEALLRSDPALQIIGQGSWLRGPAGKAARLSRQYADPLLGGSSDHDLRLVLQGEDNQLLAQWKAVRDRLAGSLDDIFRGKSAAEIERLLVQRYGYTAEQVAAMTRRMAQEGGDDLAAWLSKQVLRSVNLYPPPQVMRHVASDATARALFQRAGAMPNLAGELVEGIWGEGSTAMIQTFEAQGRLFHTAGGTVRAGFTDLVHLGEGYGRHTMGGYANMAYQWAEKAGEAAHARDPEAFRKYLSRLKDNLERARAKGNLGSGVLDDALRQIDDLIAQARGGAAVFENPRLAAILRESRLNSRLLGELARNPGPMDRQIIEAILGKSSGRLARFGEAMRQIWEQADNWTMFERGLQGAFLAWSVMSVSGTWGEAGAEQALRQAGADVAFFVGFVPGIMAMITNFVLDAAKDAGYDLAVSAQEYREFLAGISAVKGYEGETGIETTIERMATDFCTRGEVERFVERQAHAIAQLKETGAPEESEATARAREGIKQALVQRMLPIVYHEWLRARKERMIRAIDRVLATDDAFNAIILRAQAAPLMLEEGQTTGAAEITIQADGDWRPIEEALDAVVAEIEPLGGRNPLATGGLRKPVQCDWEATLRWTRGAERREESSSRRIGTVCKPQTFTFAEAGTHEVTAEFQLALKVLVGGGAEVAPDVMTAKPLIVRTYTRKIPVAVEVTRVARARPAPPKATAAVAPERVGAGEVFTLRIDRRQFPDLKLRNYQVLLLEPGRKLTFEDAALLQFDPTGGTVAPEGVRGRVSVVAERPAPDAVELDVQVRQVGAFAEPAVLDLAVVQLDEAGSPAGDLEKAMADLEKAQQDMEEAMAKMTPEQIAEMERKIEEELAKAATAPPPAVEDVLKPPPMFSVPLVVRPARLEVQVPEGWREHAGYTPPRRGFSRSTDEVTSLERAAAVQGEFTISLEDAVEDAQNWNRAADPAGLGLAPDTPGLATVPLTTPGGYVGRLVRYTPADSVSAEERKGYREQDGRSVEVTIRDERWRRAWAGGAALRRGDVWLLASYRWSAEGARRTETTAGGSTTVVFDTIENAQRAADALPAEIEVFLRSLGVAARISDHEPAPPRRADTGPGSEVRLEAAKSACEPGEAVEIACVIDFAKAGAGPYRYEWGGNHLGSGDKVLFLASEPGDYAVTVMVRDAAGKVVGSNSINLQVR